MKSSLLIPYQDPARHQAIADIIRRHSSNKQDVRLAMLKGCDLSRMEEVLDLGCGYGFMAEELAPRIAAGGRMTGIDACGDNESFFLDRVRSRGRRARFIRADIGAELPYPDSSLDLVISSYSLYFFPEVIPAVARATKPEGFFFVLTHSEKSFAGLLHAVGISLDGSSLLSLIRSFSAENGASLLAESFGEVRRVTYRNILHFYREDLSDLIAYLHFKLPLLVPASGGDSSSTATLVAKARDTLRRLGWVKVEKDDVAFICRRPR